MTQFILVFVSLVILSNDALAGRYLSSISMTVDSREGLYLEPNKTIASNPLVKAEAKEALAKLYDTNRRIVEFKEEIRTSCYARNVKTGEFVRFSDLTDGEFVVWERMRGEKADLKKYTVEYIAQRKAYLEAKEKLLKEEVANLDESKNAKFGKGADARAQELNIKAAQAEHLLEQKNLEKSVVDKASRDFALAEEKFLKGHLPTRIAKPAYSGKVAGAVGAAVIGASVVYDLATGEGAQASELKPTDLESKAGEPAAQERSDVGISTLDDN